MNWSSISTLKQHQLRGDKVTREAVMSHQLKRCCWIHSYGGRWVLYTCIWHLIISVQIHAAEFPIITQMALDYLAIPATSVSVEKVFSKSQHISSNIHSSLKENIITMALLTKVWIWSGLFKMMPPKIQQWRHGDKWNEIISLQLFIYHLSNIYRWLYCLFNSLCILGLQ